jgi:hypothetical protein
VLVGLVISVGVDVVLDNFAVFGPNYNLSLAALVVLERRSRLGSVVKLKESVFTAFPLFNGFPVL